MHAIKYHIQHGAYLRQRLRPPGANAIFIDAPSDITCYATHLLG